MKYYLAGCSRAYQQQNIIDTKHRGVHAFTTLLDNELVEIKYDIVSSDGIAWYPLNTLTTELATY